MVDRKVAPPINRVVFTMLHMFSQSVTNYVFTKTTGVQVGKCTV